MNKIKAGDEVLVISGKERGKKGFISNVINNSLVVIDGLNLAKKHQKPNPNKNEPGGITNKAMPVHISNIAIVNPETGERDKIKITVNNDGKKVRCFKSSGGELGKSAVKKVGNKKPDSKKSKSKK
jgi:large subunit ribosomal protein L24